MSADQYKEDPRSTRLVCAKLYEGGLFSSYEILSNIKQKPFKGKSPEFELDIDTITKHAEAAFRRHMKLALIAIALSFLGLIFYIPSFYLSCVLSVSAICLLVLKPVFDRHIAFENFSKKSFKPDYNLNNSSENGILAKFCDWLVQKNINSNKNKTKEQNVIVFGDYFPFLGAGKRVDYWNFVIGTSKKEKKESKNEGNSNLFCEDLSKQQNEQDNKQELSDLSINDLYKTVYDEINSKYFPSVSCDYILFADGEEIENVKFLFDEDNEFEPRTYLEDIDPFSENHIQDTFKDYRTYLTIKFHDKTRSTLFSTFLRFSEVGKNIFAECSFYVLTPIDENKFNVDKLPINEKFFSLKVGITTFGLVTTYIIFAIIFAKTTPIPIPSFILFSLSVLPLIRILCKRNNESEYQNDVKKQIDIGKPHNYGQFRTFREIIASPYYKNYFSAQDIMMVQGSLEKSIINSIADLLDKKELDSSFLRKDMTSIVNYGILQSGGTINNSPIASGNNSTITQTSQARMNQIQQKISTRREAQI